jgi:hypothetical protein
VARHQREILPLLHRRYLFAGVENYRLYDFMNTDGVCNEDVFAYSNRSGGERALVIIHNKFGTARGWIHTSAAFMVKTGQGDERALSSSLLGEGLAIGRGDNTYTIFRDQASSLEYIRPNTELFERGLYLELNAYQTHVFLDFREVQDNEWRHYGQLVNYLNGQGVPSISEALRETFLQPIHAPYRELVNADLARRSLAQRTAAKPTPLAGVEGEALEPLKAEDTLVVINVEDGLEAESALEPDFAGERPGNAAPAEGAARAELLDEVEGKLRSLAQEIKTYTEGTGDAVALAQEVRLKLERLLQLDLQPGRSMDPNMPDYLAALDYIRSNLGDAEWAWGALLAWLFTHPLGKLVTDTGFDAQSRSWVDEWLLRKIIAGTLRELGADEAGASRGVLLVNALISQQNGFKAPAGEPKAAYRVLETWLKDEDVRGFLQVNRYQDVLWYNKEAFDQLLALMLLVAMVDAAPRPEQTLPEATPELRGTYALVRALRLAQAKSDYRVEKLLAAARGAAVTGPP